MSSHINATGEFQSDKYPACPPGKIPLSVKDPMAQDLLWRYAQRRRFVDAEFSSDLETALKNAGYKPPQPFPPICDCGANVQCSSLYGPPPHSATCPAGPKRGGGTFDGETENIR